MQFDTFQGLLNYCKICTLCGSNCSILIDIVDIPVGWIDNKNAQINNKLVHICGEVVKIIDENKEKTPFEIIVPFDDSCEQIDTSQFPGNFFEFFIDARCKVCENRYVSTEDILVDENGMSNFLIEEETVYSDDFCIEINYSDGEVEITDPQTQKRVLNLTINDIGFDLSDIDKINTKLKKFIMLS